MSNNSKRKITLESRLKLPAKVQEIICDSCLITQHASSTVLSNELSSTMLKQMASMDGTLDSIHQHIVTSEKSLGVLNECTRELEGRLPAVSELHERMSLMERSSYFCESGRQSIMDNESS